MARLDNLFDSPWLNVKLGKFELDNLLSEKRILTLTGNGGIYQLYHFIPIGDGNIFGQMGDNQLGLEVMGHSCNDRTRYSAALLSSNDGTTQLPYDNAYTGFFTCSQAFDTGRARGATRRLLRHGRRSSHHLAHPGGVVYPAAADHQCRSGIGNKSFSREGFVGQFYFGPHVDLTVVTQHGEDNAWFGQGYGDLIDGVATPTTRRAQRFPLVPRPHLERRALRTSLRL